MAKKIKYKTKTKPKYRTGIQDLETDSPQGDGNQGSQSASGMLGNMKGMMGKGGGAAGAIGGATSVFNNFSDAMSLGKAGEIQTKSDAAGDSTDNPYKEGVGGQAMLKGGIGGAQAGMKVGGPIGAIIGGAIGVGSGVVKGIANAKARKGYEAYNTMRLKNKGYAKQQDVDDPYQNLKYMKGTKYKSKPNQKLDDQAKAKNKANIEFEGGEPIFSPKKTDGTRDLLYFDKSGPKHSEGGIPAKVVSKSKYKMKAGSKEIQKPEASPVEVPEGSAIVTAKKNLGIAAVLAHKAGRHDLVEKIIDKMPEDKGKKAEGGKYKVNKNTGKVETTYKTKGVTGPTDAKKSVAEQEAKKINRTGTTNSTTEADTSKNNHTYKLKNLSKEDADSYNQHRQTFSDHQKVLAAHRAKVGHDLNYNEQRQALDTHNKANGTNYSLENYQNSVNGIDNLAKKQGVDINLRGTVEGKEGRTGGGNQTGMFGDRNANARFDYEENPIAPANPATAPAAENKVDSNIPLKGQMSTTADKPNQYKMKGNGIGLRASDVNNMYRGLEKPEVEHYDKVPTYNQSYYDLSDPARRQSTQAAKMQANNAVNLSGGSAGNARTNMNAAYADNANRQQGINAFELGRFGDIKNANTQNKQSVAAQNVGISNEEKNVNAANRQATKDQFQTGLVGMDENNYRNKITNDQYNVDQQKNDIENKKLNLLKNGFVKNYDFDKDYNVGYKKKGAKNLKFKPKKKS